MAGLEGAVVVVVVVVVVVTTTTNNKNNDNDTDTDTNDDSNFLLNAARACSAHSGRIARTDTR